MCGASEEVAWLPIAFSADVRMSVEQALRTRRTKLPKGRGGISLCIANYVDMDVSTRWATNQYAGQPCVGWCSRYMLRLKPAARAPRSRSAGLLRRGTCSGSTDPN